MLAAFDGLGLHDVSTSGVALAYADGAARKDERVKSEGELQATLALQRKEFERSKDMLERDLRKQMLDQKTEVGDPWSLVAGIVDVAHHHHFVVGCTVGTQAPGVH